MSRWFRLDDDVINDPKILLLPEAMRWIWVAFLCIASKNSGQLPSNEIIALSLRVKPTKSAEYLTRLVIAGLIDKTETGFAPHNWAKRQFKSDEKASGKDSYVYFIGRNWGATLKIGFSKNPWARLYELQTAQPEKIEVLAVFKCKSVSEVDLHDVLKEFRKNGEWFDLPTNIYVAIHNASDRKCSYDDLVVELRELLRSTTTHTQAHTQTQTKIDPPLRVVDDWPENFGDLFWQAYPRKEEKISAMKKLAMIRKSGIVTFADLMAGVKRYCSVDRDPQFIKQPTVWLNKGCWADETRTGASNGNRTGNTRTTGHDAILAVAARKARELDRNDDVAGTANPAGFAFGNGTDRSGPSGNSDAVGRDPANHDRLKPDDQRIREGEIIPPDKDAAGVPSRRQFV